MAVRNPRLDDVAAMAGVSAATVSRYLNSPEVVAAATGARIREAIEGDLKALVDEKAGVLAGWMAEGRIARLPPHHLIFAVWALTQHYADFDMQVRAVLGAGRDPLAEAGEFLETLFRKLLAI